MLKIKNLRILRLSEKLGIRIKTCVMLQTVLVTSLSGTLAVRGSVGANLATILELCP